MKYDRDILIERLKQLQRDNKKLVKQGLAQNDISTNIKMGDKLGVNEKTIRNWLNGSEKGTDIPVQYLIELADLFGCDIDYLIGSIKEKTRISADIVAETGLSEEAVNILCELKKEGIKIPGEIISDLIISIVTGSGSGTFLIQSILDYKNCVNDILQFESKNNYDLILEAYNNAFDNAFDELGIIYNPNIYYDLETSTELLYKFDQVLFFCFAEKIKDLKFENNDIKDLFNEVKHYLRITENDYKGYLTNKIQANIVSFLNDYLN